jgi:hypothetical protein
MDSNAFSQRLLSLPQELLDMIHDHTFTADNGIRNIDQTYKPSHLLQVDHLSRQKYAASFYGRASTFHFACKITCLKWTMSVAAEHRYQIRHIRVGWLKPFESANGTMPRSPTMEDLWQMTLGNQMLLMRHERFVEEYMFCQVVSRLSKLCDIYTEATFLHVEVRDRQSGTTTWIPLDLSAWEDVGETILR